HRSSRACALSAPGPPAAAPSPRRRTCRAAPPAHPARSPSSIRAFSSCVLSSPRSGVCPYEAGDAPGDLPSLRHCGDGYWPVVLVRNAAWSPKGGSAERRTTLEYSAMSGVVPNPVAQVCRVAALESPDELQLDVAGIPCLEQAAAGAQQDRNEVDFQLVELAGLKQRLRRACAVRHHGTIARRGPGLSGTCHDIGIKLRAARRHVAFVDMMGQHVDRHAAVMIAAPAAGV